MTLTGPGDPRVLQALEHVNAERAARPGVPLVRLVDEAALRFDLDAAASEWLLRTVMEDATSRP